MKIYYDSLQLMSSGISSLLTEAIVSSFSFSLLLSEVHEYDDDDDAWKWASLDNRVCSISLRYTNIDLSSWPKAGQQGFLLQ